MTPRNYSLSVLLGIHVVGALGWLIVIWFLLP